MVMTNRPGGKRPVVLRDKAQGPKAKAETTDAPYRVGPLHSSDEALVMRVERRERLIAVEFGPTGNGKSLHIQWKIETFQQWDEP